MIKIWLLLAIGLVGFQALAKDDPKIDQARKEAEIYAQRSLEARKKPERKLSAEEAEAEEVIKKAEVLIAEADCIKDEDEVIKLYQDAAKIAPGYDKSWWGLGMALWAKTNYLPKSTKEEKAEMLKILAQAKQACQKALEIDPMSPGANYWLSNILLTEASLGNWVKGAIILPTIFKLSDKVAAVDPYYEHGAVFRTYAIVLTTVPTWLAARFGFTPEIILPYLDKAIELEPDYFANYLVRTGIYREIGGEENKQKALQDLDYVLRHDPNALEGYQAENRKQQKDARNIWKQITGKNYPDR